MNTKIYKQNKEMPMSEFSFPKHKCYLNGHKIEEKKLILNLIGSQIEIMFDYLRFVDETVLIEEKKLQ